MEGTPVRVDAATESQKDTVSKDFGIIVDTTAEVMPLQPKLRSYATPESLLYAQVGRALRNTDDHGDPHLVCSAR